MLIFKCISHRTLWNNQILINPIMSMRKSAQADIKLILDLLGQLQWTAWGLQPWIWRGRRNINIIFVKDSRGLMLRRKTLCRLSALRHWADLHIYNQESWSCQHFHPSCIICSLLGLAAIGKRKKKKRKIKKKKLMFLSFYLWDLLGTSNCT